MKIVYTGSSILKFYKGHGDLSRRKIAYKLPGLSFREYLEINNILTADVVSFDELLKNHETIAAGHMSRLKILLRAISLQRTSFSRLVEKTNRKAR